MRAGVARAAAIGALLLGGPAVSAGQSAPPAGAQGTSQGQATGQVPPTIPPVTPEDRAAAFPDVTVAPVQDAAMHSLVLLDRFEWQHRDGQGGPSWEALGWVGGDLNRFWFRAEGDTEQGRVAEAEAHAFYGRAIARWWDLVAGIRQDVRPGSPQTWVAVGVQGLAPYWFDVEATAYVGAGGRTQVRFETEYELRFTNRLILQPLVELNVYGKADPERRRGAGLGTTEIGLRLRYLIRREVAPYLGVTWNQKHFGTADRARSAGEQTGGARLTLGLRLWRSE
jgi:copper resistance protein B